MHVRFGFVLLLLLSPTLAANEPVIEATKTHLDFRHGKELFTRYVIAESAAKPYFFPLYVTPGQRVTRGWPMEKDAEVVKTDHPHQKSLWFCHGDVVPEGLEFKKYSKGVAGVDFWAEGKGHGKIVCIDVGKPTMDKTQASVVTKNEWRTAEGQKILDETRTLTYVPMGAGMNLLVFDINLHASVAPITFADTKEGSLGVRVRETMRTDRGKPEQLSNAEGKTGERGVWGHVSPWCDYSGPVGDKETAGIAVFADPKNSLDTAWHSRGYGLMAANPFGREKHSGFPGRKGNNTPVKIGKGDHLKLRYGVYVHTGDVKSGKVAEAFDRFVKLSGK